MTKQTGQERPLWRRLLQWSFLRYVLVGASGAAVDFLVFLLSYQAMRGLVPSFARGAANAAGMLVGAAYCFLLNRSWSFRSPGRFWRQAAGYAALMTFNIFLSSFVMGLLTERLGLPLPLCKIAVMGMIFLWNYLISRFLIFRKKHTARRQEG